jgi:hypothetical protein
MRCAAPCLPRRWSEKALPEIVFAAIPFGMVAGLAGRLVTLERKAGASRSETVDEQLQPAPQLRSGRQIRVQPVDGEHE